MKKAYVIALLFFAGLVASQAQNRININAVFDIENKSIAIEQNLQYKNITTDTLTEIYLSDWNNSYSTKTTPLAQRFTEEFEGKFHFAKSRDRGFSVITSIRQNESVLDFQNLRDHPDVVKVKLEQPLLPGNSYDITLFYTVTIPNSAFTDYGIDSNKDLNLRYWYITPAVYDGQWHYYSNKNLDDLFAPISDILISAKYPRNYSLVSELNSVYRSVEDGMNVEKLQGANRLNTSLILQKISDFNTLTTQGTTIVSNIAEKDLQEYEKAIVTDRVLTFIRNYIGEYPHGKFLLTQTDYDKDPLYGLTQLPDFFRPFSDSFLYELKVLKTALQQYFENTLITNPREDYWLNDGLQIYYLMKYIEVNYPDKKFLGQLAQVWGVRSFHAADLKFNEQYTVFFMEMARNNRDQPLVMPKDSLIKFNANIAGKYKAGIGLKYLDDFINGGVLERSIKRFLDAKRLQHVKTTDFENYLKGQTNKDINWFFEDYLKTRKKIDFKIQDLVSDADSITFTIKNKRDNSMPISLFRLKNDSILSKEWIENIDGLKTLTIPRRGADKLALNHDQTIPEYNLRDNYESLKGAFFNNKPLQLRLFKDFEDPYYNQVFLMPLIEFNNIYDGLTLGTKFYNKTILRKGFNYKLSPQYATNSKAFTGGGSLYYQRNIENQNLYNLWFGLSGKYNSIAEDAFVTVISPAVSLNFRNDKDFRSNKLKLLNLRYLSIKRTVGEDALIEINEPNYDVINLRYIDSDRGLIRFSSWYSDLQFAQDFGKLSLNYEYRKLSESNRLFSLRLFAGAFLYNKTPAASDYFSFALDRPTDYLFDYNYLGRAESSGIYSQQIIIAEGGFKSQLPIEFANQWMTTMNTSYTMWRYFELYGDLGLVKSKGGEPYFAYDAGVRVNLVPDYLELFFPIYSNLGWEVAQEQYDQKIRFKVVVDPQVLLGLFKRKWY